MAMQNRTREQTPRRGWPIPAALVALSAIPLIFVALRLLQLAGGPELIPAEERFAEFPLAVALHILAELEGHFADLPKAEPLIKSLGALIVLPHAEHYGAGRLGLGYIESPAYQGGSQPGTNPFFYNV